MNLRTLKKIFNKANVLFVGGLVGVAFETFVIHTPNLELLILFASMMGLPAFFNPAGYQNPYNKKNDKDDDED
jgi:hypothetical protein